MEKSTIEARFFSVSNLPKLFTAEVVAPETHMTSERLIELADMGFIPCVRIDGGEPLFHKQDLKDYIKKNLIHYQDGKILPQKLIITQALKKTELKRLPTEIEHMRKELHRFDHVHYPPCVYFLVKDNKIVYIGQSIALSSRIEQHSKDKDFDKCFFVIVDKEKLLDFEYRMIEALQPPLNKQPFKKKEEVKSE